jgi:hypothetical protein
MAFFYAQKFPLHIASHCYQELRRLSFTFANEFGKNGSHRRDLMLKMTLVTLLILAAACGKAPSMPKSKNEKSVSPLNGKTTGEILDLKYNNQINLNCELRVQKGVKVDLSKAPTDEFSWRILGDVSVLRFLNYKIGNKELIVAFKVVSTVQILDQLTHVNEKKQEFFLQYSPVLRVEFRRAAKSTLSNGSIHNRDSFEDVKLYENIQSRFYTMTSQEKDEVVTEDVRCTLQTKINPAYTDQWARVK